jgi:hypothetical protein
MDIPFQLETFWCQLKYPGKYQEHRETDGQQIDNQSDRCIRQAVDREECF